MLLRALLARCDNHGAFLNVDANIAFQTLNEAVCDLRGRSDRSSKLGHLFDALVLFEDAFGARDVRNEVMLRILMESASRKLPQ